MPWLKIKQIKVDPSLSHSALRVKSACITLLAAFGTGVSFTLYLEDHQDQSLFNDG